MPRGTRELPRKRLVPGKAGVRAEMWLPGHVLNEMEVNHTGK